MKAIVIAADEGSRMMKIEKGVF